jgi:hypothetical protein
MIVAAELLPAGAVDKIDKITDVAAHNEDARRWKEPP